MAKEKVKKPFYKKWWVWLLAIIVIAGIAGQGEETDKTVSEPKSQETTVEDNTTTEESTDTETTEEVAEAEQVSQEPVEEVKEEEQEPSMSVSQESAVRKAGDYISMGGFSKSGLIEQLKFEGFPPEDATFAVDNISVDWKEQAKIKAESYMDMQGFSRQGLIEQLTFEGFTTEEATYGAEQVGL